jgi:hypothetical protein
MRGVLPLFFIFKNFLIMAKSIAIKYIDAMYTNEKARVVEYLRTPPCAVALGLLSSVTAQHIVLAFQTSQNKNVHGLLLPLTALVLHDSHSNGNHNEPIGRKVGIYWNDITHFTDGMEPKSLSRMYTEGTFFCASAHLLAVKDPETICLSQKRPKNHPSARPRYYVIPHNLITHREYYES